MEENEGIIQKILNAYYIRHIRKKREKRKLKITDKEKEYLNKIFRGEIQTNLELFNKFFSEYDTKILMEFGDSESIQYCLRENKITSEILIRNFEYKKRLMSLGSSDLIKLCLDKAKSEGLLNKGDFDFNTYNIAELLTLTDDEYIRQYIDGFSQIFALDEKKRLFFISYLSGSTEGRYDSYFREKFKPTGELPITFDLPKEMTIGMEIEAKGENAAPCLYGWHDKPDKTLHGPSTEVVSPILRATKQDAEDVYIMCNMLQSIGMKVEKDCGGHIHIGVDYLTKDQSLENLIALWCNTEGVLYKICNDKGDKLRGTYYAKPISGKIGEHNLYCSSLIDTYMRFYEDKKFLSMNLRNIKNPKKKTIEFRISNGTLEPEVWIQNANLFGGMVRVAEELTQIMYKRVEDRTPVDVEKLENFKTLCTTECTEEQKLDILLKLAVSPESREIYQKRYEENSKLIEEDEKLFETLNQGIATKPITPKRVARKIFTGKDAVTGEQMTTADQRLRKDVEKNKGKNQELGQEI